MPSSGNRASAFLESRPSRSVLNHLSAGAIMARHALPYAPLSRCAVPALRRALGVSRAPTGVVSMPSVS
jgi:hypothetical protein